MKRFLSKRTPPLNRLLLVESGSRSVAEQWLAAMGAINPHALTDVVTCYSGRMAGRAPASIFSTADYPDRDARERLAAELARNRYDVVAILCTAEPVMTRWKWFLAWRVPAKVIIVNENADWFWLDRGHAKIALRFIAFRLGLSGSGAFTQPLRLLMFPFALIYLAIVAVFIHLRRKVFS